MNSSRFKLTAGYNEVFRQLKMHFNTVPILHPFNAADKCIMETKASDFVIMVVLSQMYEKRLHPVVFYSRKKDKLGGNYDIHDNKTSAIRAVPKPR